MYEKIEAVFDLIIEYCILIIELVGVCVLIWAITCAVIGLFRKRERLRLDLAEGIALSLEFKIGGELLRTLIVREWSELLILGSIILLRAALTFLIQWEIRTEEKKVSAKVIQQDARHSDKPTESPSSKLSS